MTNLNLAGGGRDEEASQTHDLFARERRERFARLARVLRRAKERPPQDDKSESVGGIWGELPTASANRDGAQGSLRLRSGQALRLRSRPLSADENFAQDDKSKSRYFSFAGMTNRKEKTSGPIIPGTWILRLCSGQAAEGGCPHMGIVVPQSQTPTSKSEDRPQSQRPHSKIANTAILEWGTRFC